MRMALRDCEIACGVRLYPKRLWSSRGQAFQSERSARSAVSHPPDFSNRSRRSHPKHLQFCDARSPPRPGRCENLVTRRKEAFEEVTQIRNRGRISHHGRTVWSDFEFIVA